MHEGPTTVVIQRYRDALPGDAAAEPVVREKNRPSSTGAIASSLGPFSTGPKTFTRHPSEDFAGATPRQLGVEEFNPAWNLVIGERAPAVSHQIIRTEDLSRFQHDTGHHELTPV